MLIRRGTISALGIAVVLSFTFPVWLEVPIIGIPMGVRTFVSIALLILFAIRDPRAIWSPLTVLDTLIAGMVIVHVVSDSYHGWNVALAGLRAYGEWAVPYVAGRYAMRSSREMEPLAACVSGVVILLGVTGLIEMALGVNLWELLFGNRPIDNFARNNSRFGLKRAFGTTLHPIYFGMLGLILAPWPLALAFWSKEKRVFSLAISGLAASFIGVCASLSRGPVLGAVIFLCLLSGIWSRWCRWLLAIGCTALALWLAVDFRGVVSQLERLGGEESRVTKLKLDGQNVELSSFRHRLLLIQVYWPALQHAGWLGYGTESIQEVPPKVPFLPADPATRATLRFVDNSFVFNTLRFGWSGALIFSGLFVAAAITGIRLAWDRSIGVLASTLAAMTMAAAVSLATVWFSYDMGFELLWSFGVIAGLSSQQRTTDWPGEKLFATTSRCPMLTRPISGVIHFTKSVWSDISDQRQDPEMQNASRDHREAFFT